MTQIHDLDRLRAEYADRERRLAGDDRYSYFNPGHLFMVQERQCAVLQAIRQAGLTPLTDRRILEVGCGNGGVLLEFLSYGALPSNLFGVELLSNRVIQAHARLPHLALACADAQALPYSSHTFDLVMQFTVFSSILDGTIKANIASEMLRVLKPSGLILWYDFWINPINPQTRGVRRSEIRRLFPGCNYRFRRVTLAPPIARRLAPHSWMLCHVLERARFLNTHYLAEIKPLQKDS